MFFRRPANYYKTGLGCYAVSGQRPGHVIHMTEMQFKWWEAHNFPWRMNIYYEWVPVLDGETLEKLTRCQCDMCPDVHRKCGRVDE